MAELGVDNDTAENEGTLAVPGEPRSSKAVLDALTSSEKAFRSYDKFCDEIDQIYSARTDLQSVIADIGYVDQEYDLFWASMEILKPAIYAKPPQVVAKPRFGDANATDRAAAELIERVVNSEFERSHIDEAMLGVRDDLALLNRGVPWVTYEAVDGEKKVCVEHLCREDFRHEPARKWGEVGWASRGAWLTQREMAKRFRKASGMAYKDADYRSRKEYDDDDGVLKARVWEVWHKADNKVYWVTEGVEVLLDEGEPHLSIRDFFPCPRPAYGTLRRNSLIPQPDYRRYMRHLDQINLLTRRIYDLLGQVKLRGLIPSGGDVGSAIETAINENDSAMFIPVPGAALMASGGAASFVQFLPLQEMAAAIQGLIQARNQLFDDFYQLSGISDIMRGATEAEETLGAQRMKAQYGSVRVRDKIDEIVRVARDLARITAEIICDNFTEKDLLEISMMDFPKRKEVEKSIKDVSDAAKRELKELEEQAVQQQAEDPQQAQQQFQAAQQAVIEKFAPQLQQLQNAVVIEDVMTSIKDRRLRGLAIDIETDSTVMVDEAQEKQQRSEFLQAFSGAVGQLQPLVMLGEAGAKLAGGILKFTLQPYHVDRQLEALIDDFVREAPEMAGQAGEGDDLAAAQSELAKAEMLKGQAAMAKVQADSQLKQAEMQQKMTEMQVKAQEGGAKHQAEIEKLRQSNDKLQAETAKTGMEIEKIRAETDKILASIGMEERKQAFEEVKAVDSAMSRDEDKQIAQQDSAVERQFRERDESRADAQLNSQPPKGTNNG